MNEHTPKQDMINRLGYTIAQTVMHSDEVHERMDEHLKEFMGSNYQDPLTAEGGLSHELQCQEARRFQLEVMHAATAFVGTFESVREIWKEIEGS